MREHLGRFGSWGRSISVFAERGGVWLRTPVKGRTLTRFGDDTAAVRRKALAYAKRYAEAREDLRHEREPRRGLTLRVLWERYQRALGETWRPKTVRGYRAYQDSLEEHFGPAARVGEITLDMVDAYRDTRRSRRPPIAHGQVRREIGFLRQMLNFAEGRELVARNRLRAYRYVVPRDERPDPPAEYSREQVFAIAAELAAPRHWRARTVITLCGTYGARINAVLHLQWGDVDLDAGTVTWRAAYDKTGAERTLPMTPQVRAALTEAYGQRHEREPWVFWAVKADAVEGRRPHRSSRSAPKGRPIHYNTVWSALRAAEDRAEVPHIPGRAFHGLRRMVVGDMGDLALAGAWVGQKSLKVTAGYDRARAEQIEEAAERMTARETPPNRHRTAGGA